MMLSESLKGVVAQTLCKKIGGGRVAALEVLLVNSAVANLIREGKTFQIPSIMQTAKNVGMRLMNEALCELVVSKQVTLEEAIGQGRRQNWADHGPQESRHWMSQGVKVQIIRRYPGLAAALLTGFSCLLWPLAARAATCVVVDEQRDGLTAAARLGAHVI